MTASQLNRPDSGLPVRKTFLFLLSRGPFDGLYAQECLDICLTSAAFEQSVSLLFLDGGIQLLKKEQRPNCISAKHIAPLFKALDLYGVSKLWAEEESLQECGLTPKDLLVPVQLLQRSKVAALIAQNDVIYSG